MATVLHNTSEQATNSSPSLNNSQSPDDTSNKSHPISHRPVQDTVLTTLYNWPTIEPVRYEQYSSLHLDMPLRRDILHRAVIYEGDATRSGTASTKWRGDVHGSGRKILPQKGTGNARAGDKKSPIRRGGGVAFGPHPRNFATGLNRKIYDIAWRTALSHRYRKGELVVIDNTISMPWDATPHLLNNLFYQQGWGKGNGRSTLVTLNSRPRLNQTMEQLGEHGVVKDLFDLDVKDLLETGRIIIERFALDALIGAHVSDLGHRISLEMAHKHNQSLYRKYRAQKMLTQEVEAEQEQDEAELDLPPAQEQIQNMSR